MKQLIITLLLASLTCNLLGQNTNIWTSFWNNDSTLIGYKDKNGVIKIEAKFSSAFCAYRFENIMAVMEEKGDKWDSYYLTKSGRILGRDSLHFFDNGADCESEGFIRFRDKKTDKVGMFNRDGAIVIPALYNDLTRVRNGLVLALKGAVKKTEWGGEHYNWVGGQEILIDTLNRIIIENFKINDNLNYYSLKVTAEPLQDSIRKTYKGIDNQFYSFVDFEKEFNSWLQTIVLKDLTKSNLLKHSFDSISWETESEWKTEAKDKFMDRNYKLIISKLKELKAPTCDYFISKDGLNQFMFNTPAFEKYYNNLGESKDWIYPTMSIIISQKESQDHLDFLRTDDGYKLLCITIRNGEIK